MVEKRNLHCVNAHFASHFDAVSAGKIVLRKSIKPHTLATRLLNLQTKFSLLFKSNANQNMGNH